MGGEQEAWALKRFVAEFELWAGESVDAIAQYPPDDAEAAIRITVLNWVFTRQEDPYSGAVREPGLGNWWRARIPNTMDGHREMVYCTYQIFEDLRVVYCRGFATNSWL